MKYIKHKFAKHVQLKAVGTFKTQNAELRKYGLLFPKKIIGFQK